MRCRRPRARGRLACRAVAASWAVLVAGTAGAQSPGRVVIPRAHIEAAGWVNIGEMIAGALGWHRVTLDAVTYFVNGDGAPPGTVAPSEPEWIVLVDGQRVGVGTLGARMLDLLPVSPAQIESVTVSRAPRLAGGTIAARGVVEFHSRAIRRGLSAAGAWQSGNVIGDPGPYVFTPLAEDNVDRLGPYDQATASFGGRGWDLTVGAREGSSHITHRDIRERYDPTLYDQLGANKWAPFDVVNARLGARLLGSRHDVVAGRGWVSGPLFFPLAGREQWIRGMQEHLGATGSVTTGPVTTTYDVASASLTVGELESPFPFTVGHVRRRTHARVEVSRGRSAGRAARAGVTAARWSLERGGSTADRMGTSAFAALGAPIGRFRNELSASLGRSSDGPVVGKGIAHASIDLDSVTVVAATFGYSQYATGDDGEWIERALLGVDTAGRARNARVSADVALSRRMGTWTADIAGRFAIAGGVERIASSGPIVGGTSDLGQAEVGFGVSRAATRLFPVARARYRLAFPVGGNGDVREAVRATPRHSLDGAIVAAIAPDVRLGGFAHVASRSRWPALRGGAAEPLHVPSVTRLDASVEKWFWRHRIRSQLLVRNLLNRPERYHPLGATLPLRVHLTLGVDVP